MLKIHAAWLALALWPLWLAWPQASLCNDSFAGSIQQTNHRAWAVANGAPADVWDIEQDGKGFIWLTTSTGLFRWDGFRFERYAPTEGQAILSTDMTALRIVSDDDFWTGTSDGVIYHIKDRQIASYPISNDGKEGPVYCFAATPDGGLWVVAGRALLRYGDGKLKKVGADWNFPPDTQAMWMVVDKEGTAWLATDRELLFLRKGSHRFEHTGIPTGLYSVLALSPDGTLWVSDGVHGTRALPGLSVEHIPSTLLQPLPLTAFAQSERLAFDHSGALWGTFAFRSGNSGIFRVPHPARFADGQPLRPEQVPDRFSTEQGFTSIVTVPILVDHEGDVWIGTNFGLHRFHTNSFTIVSPLTGASPAEVWLSHNGAGRVLLLQRGCLYQVSHATPSKVTCDLPTGSYQIFAAADRFISQTATDFYQWSAQAGGSSLQLPGNHASWDTTAIGMDAQGNLWLGFSGGLYKLNGNAWQRVTADGILGHKQPTAIAFDPDNTMWLGYADGRVVSSRGNATTVYSTSDGLSIGNVEVIVANGRSILLGGDTGVARLWNGHFQSITLARLHVLSAVSGVVETTTGDLWLNTSVGIVRIEASETNRAFDDPSYTPSYTLYGSDDGVPGVSGRQPFTSTITMDEDGRLWFQTNQGVCWIDPASVHINRVALHTVIESVLAEGKQVSFDGHMVFPPHTSTISFLYTAASLRAPQNVKFRYRLSGVDADWQEEGPQRQAIYANLGPGDYEFQVEAANSDGVWSKSPATLPFRIKRALYQTRGFQIASVAIALLFLAGVVVFQYRKMARTFRDRLEIRHAERERIARELHDTLLQGIQGLILFFQAVPDHIPKEDPFRAKLNQALDRAHRVLTEGRSRVRDLRASDNAMSDLVVAFTTLAQELAEEWPAKFQVVSEGAPRDIDQAIREEVYLIGREALLNAFQHARASEIDVCVGFDAKQLRVLVRDNGIGIDLKILEANHRPGHWGLVGMQERATSIGGHLATSAKSGMGTMVKLIVPSGIAYARPRQFRSTWFKRRFARRIQMAASDQEDV
jgi:signal transduction histidine kinase/ligand-binding sensor domain-containing protein